MRRSIVLVIAAAIAAVPFVVATPSVDDLPVHRAYHDVLVEPGVTLRVVEAWTDASLEREEPLAALFISPTLVTHEVWDAQVPEDPGYSGLWQAAQRGYHAYAFDHWGYGGSSLPANGMDVTFERMVPQTAAVLEWARERSGAERVDLVSGSLGNSIAFALGGSESPIADHVGSIVMTANVYANASLVLRSTILSPLVCDLQPPPPDGYTDTPPPLYAIIRGTPRSPRRRGAIRTSPAITRRDPRRKGATSRSIRPRRGAHPRSWRMGTTTS